MLMDTMYKNIKSLVNSSIIKFEKTARQYETLESIENADTFIAASQKADRFDLYNEFSLEAIINANITNDPELQFKYASNPSSIPSIYRDRVLEAERSHIINSYVEINNYYRMLNGLPNIEENESEFIKLTKLQMIRNEIFDDVYIHQLSDNDIYKLMDSGLLDQIIKENPTKKYLNYLGVNRIDIIEARLAHNFSILHISGSDIPEEFYNTFVQMYNQNREYFMSIIYNSSFSDSYELYDNFIGLCIMLMTIQRILSNTFKFGIQREFYDWTFIQNMYKTYNVPFIESMPIEYQITLLKNLNNLLRYKSTDKVLFDICSLLGFERLKIFKYYLVKRHKLDADKNPIFCYKKITDEEGNVSYVEDVEKMYDLYFQGVNIKERNLALALQDDSNELDYNEVTMNDPYWWEDAALTEAKYNNVYNYIETKYISLTMMYKMTEMLFEITYAFRMLQDKTKELEDFRIDIPKIYDESSFKIFDVIIFMIALLCKNHGFKDGLITTPSMISHIYGFNFNEENIEKIKSIILNNPKVVDQDIIKYFNNLTVTNAEDANTLFIKIREYNNLIIEKMRKSTSIEEYHLYKDIFTISMVSETQTDIFTINSYDEEGNLTTTVAKTYLEYLEHEQPILAEIVKTMDVNDIAMAIEHITSQINVALPSLQYMFIINGNNNPLYTAIISLITFFKSYTVDLAGFNIIYLFDSKYYQLIKLLDDIHHIDSYIYPIEDFGQHYSDEIHSFSAFIDDVMDKLRIREKAHYSGKIDNYENLILKMSDLYHHKITHLQINDSIRHYYFDTLGNIITNMGKDDILKLNERYETFIKIYQDDEIIYRDILSKMINDFDITDSNILYDAASSIMKDINKEDKLRYFENIRTGALITNTEFIYKLIDIHMMKTHLYYEGNYDHQYSTDGYIGVSHDTIKENSHLRDKLIIIRE